MKRDEVRLGQRVYRGDCTALGSHKRDDRKRWGTITSDPFFRGANWFVQVHLDSGMTIDAPLHRLKVVDSDRAGLGAVRLSG